MRIDEVRLIDLLTLQARGLDVFMGLAVSYPWGPRLFGGQVVAQSQRAAAMTVVPERRVHSLHAYFIRPGTHTEPVRFEVQRLRDGRSFSTRQVTASQSGGAILSAMVSFQAEQAEADISPVAPPETTVDPADLSMVDDGWGDLLERRTPPSDSGPRGHWIRVSADHAAELNDDPVLQDCALAFISDAAPSRAARAQHPDLRGDRSDFKRFRGASLDHAVWFHRPGNIADWHWFEMHSHGLFSGRGVVSGDVFSADGTHRATLTQQVLLRTITRPADD